MDGSAPLWTPAALRRSMARLEAARAPLEALPAERLRAAWAGAIDELLRPAPGTAAFALRHRLAERQGLSCAGLDAGLDVVLRGVRTSGALALFDTHRQAAPGPALVILASTPPGLAVQTLLPALAVRRPTLVKSSSREPFFAPAVVDALARREPLLGEALAAVTWPGGTDSLDAAALGAAGRVVAYGGGEALASLRRHLGTAHAARLVAHGPRASLAVVARDELSETVAEGLARDIALFDQRGCLSIQAIYVESGASEAAAFADAVARALERQAVDWPPGPIDAASAGAVRQLRDLAVMQGHELATLPLRSGTVVVDPDPSPRPSPGLRTVRIHPLADLAHLPRVLEPWRGRLQGVAVAGALPAGVEASLRSLGASRFAAPGRLQAPEAHAWHNAGIDPLDALAG